MKNGKNNRWWRVGGVAVGWVLMWTGATRASSDFTVLHTLTTAEGIESHGGVVPGPGGFYYGTTYRGGPYPQSFQPSDALGSLFRVNPSTGDFAVIHLFTGQRQETGEAADGRAPQGRLLQAGDGSLYGTTMKGGAEDSGTVFRVSPAGEYSTLHHFRADEGTEPRDGLIPGPDGAFYGTTNLKGPNYAGTVYRLAADGTVTTLYAFPRTGGVHDALTFGADGCFYGTLAEGGYFGPQEGVVYRLTPAGEYTVVHRFTGGQDDGDGPFGGLLVARDGALYGMTRHGGANDRGTIYRLAPDGTFAVLHSFTARDAVSYTGTLLQGRDGFFYGTINQGGQYGYGVVFQMTPDGALASLHSFDSEHGSYPDGTLFQDESGALYGTALRHGDDGAGVVFRLRFTDPPTVSLSAPVPTIALGAGSGEFRLTLSSPQPDDLTVTYEVKKGGDFNGSGYKALGGSATIKAGKTGKTLRVKPRSELASWFAPWFPGGQPFLSKLQVRIALVPGDNYRVGAERAAKVRIVPAGP